MPNIKVIGQTVRAIEHRQIDGQTDGSYQTYYLPGMYLIVYSSVWCRLFGPLRSIVENAHQTTSTLTFQMEHPLASDIIFVAPTRFTIHWRNQRNWLGWYSLLKCYWSSRHIWKMAKSEWRKSSPSWSGFTFYRVRICNYILTSSKMPKNVNILTPIKYEDLGSC